MRTISGSLLAALLSVVGLTSHGAVDTVRAHPSDATPRVPLVAANQPAAATTIPAKDLTAVMQRYCQVCHNDQLNTGNLSLQGFDVAKADAKAETAEKIIQKLRVGMMPPPGIPRPGGDTLAALLETLELSMDKSAALKPNPGTRSFQRLNRPEYEASIRDLLGLEIHAADYLPPDTKLASFDNMADAQPLSPTLTDSYLRAATVISRLAVGNPDALPSETVYRVVRQASQVDHVEGAPFGTRGGTSVVHNFPADGEYTFRLTFPHDEGGTVYGSGHSSLHTAERPEQIDISIDGEQVALLDVDRWMHESDPTGAEIKTPAVFVHSGPHRVSAAFVQRYEGPLADLLRPFGWSQTTSSGNRYGVQLVPHIRDLTIAGPYHPTGVSESEPRRKIFTCRPTGTADAHACAEQILTRLASRAFRRPVEANELAALMTFYEQAAEQEGFEAGVRTGLEAMLASPHFVFRFEAQPREVKAGEIYRISDYDLASRLSFFLWAAPPDDELIALAKQGRLSNRRVLEEKARRMLADPRSEALSTRFAAQWLRLPEIDEIEPNVNIYPDYYRQLGYAMRRETELFFDHVVREDRSALELFTADYTFVNDALARHYGMMGVVGEEFRKVQYPDDQRRGLFGHAGILMLTSVPGRTSPVLRGKWVMEVILGTPPPPPPPGVPPLENTKGSTAEGRVLTTRERMEMHSSAPVCKSCHRFMDPLGLALDNFDVVGKWRTRENGALLDTRGELYDGTQVSSPNELQEALLRRPVPILRNLSVNLMAYALGRRVEYYDMPSIRKIVSDSEAKNYAMSAFVLGVVNSPAFQMRKAAGAPDSTSNE